VTYDDSENILSFVNSQNAKELSQVGAACPDHLVHTKRVPLFVDWDPTGNDVDALVSAIKKESKHSSKNISLISIVINLMETVCLNQSHDYYSFLESVRLTQGKVGKHLM